MVTPCSAAVERERRPSTAQYLDALTVVAAVAIAVASCSRKVAEC